MQNTAVTENLTQINANHQQQCASKPVCDIPKSNENNLLIHATSQGNENESPALLEGFIGIHIGVGTYNNDNYDKYRILTNSSCQKAIDILRNGGTAADACTAAVGVLEDDPLVNAGYGSNLTFEGIVECDASIMDGTTLNFGACGAVCGIKNPINLANKICKDQSGKYALGLIPPCLLVGDGAKRYAERNGIDLIDNESLVSEQSLRQHVKYKKMLNCEIDKEKRRKICTSVEEATDTDVDGTAESSTSQHRPKTCRCRIVNNRKRHLELKEGKPSKLMKPGEQLNGEDAVRWDTVGAICLDTRGGLASACSSGGIVLKHSGRVGQAAMMGAGVWADDTTAVSTTGCGEFLIKTQLAKEIASTMSTSETDLYDILIQKFTDSVMLKNEMGEKIVGAITLVLKDDKKAAEFCWSHTLYNIGIGYMRVSDEKPRSVFSERPGTTCFRFQL